MEATRLDQFVPLKKVGTSITPKVAGDTLDGIPIGTVTPATGKFTTGEFSDDIDQGGNYLLDSASINALNAKGAGYWFDGENDLISCGNDASLDFGEYLSVLIDTNIDSVSGSYDSIFSKYQDIDNRFYLQIFPNGTMQLYAKSGGVLIVSDALTNAIEFGNPNNIAFTIQQNVALKHYMNGLLDTTIVGLGNGGMTNTGAFCMSTYSSSLFLKATHQRLLAYNRILSAAEVKALSSGAPIDFADIGADNLELWDTAASVFTAQDVTIDNVAGYVTGVNSMTVDALPLKLPVGTKLTFASGGEYIITTEAAASATTIVSTSGLTVAAVVDGEAAPSGTYSWSPYGSTTLANVSNMLEVAYVDHAGGAHADFRSSGDLSKNLVVGKRYRFSVDLSYTGGVSAPNVIIKYGDTGSSSEVIPGTPTTYIFEFVCTHVTTGDIHFSNMVAGNVITVDNLSIKRIGCVLDLNQDGIGHTQWLDNSGNENHGAVSGAIPTNLPADDVQRFRHTVAITNDTTWTSVVPAGYMLEAIVFLGANASVATIDLGTTSGASDVFSQEVIAANGITTVVINKIFSMSAAQSLYLNDDGAGTWNGASLTATLIMRRVV